MYSFGELLWRDQSIPVSAPILESSLLGTSVVRVAAGGFHCGALTEHGSVYTWGENTAGQCGPAERGAAANVTSQFQTPSSSSSSPFLLRLSIVFTLIVLIIGVQSKFKLCPTSFNLNWERDVLLVFYFSGEVQSHWKAVSPFLWYLLSPSQY